MASDLVGIQIGAISFIDEGTEQVLDTLQEKGAVNALMVSALSWSRGNAGRAIGGFPDHGVMEPDNLIGGAFWEPDPKYYGNTFIKDFRAPDPLYRGFDTLRDVIPAARKRDMQVYAYYCETPRATIRHSNVVNAAQVAEVDIFGRRAARPCNNHPAYRAWVMGFIEDWCQACDVDGVLWGIELQGGLKELLSGETPTCFCHHCLMEAQRRNIDAERAREGYKALYRYVGSLRAGERPHDGYFVSFLRLLLNYPEVLQWERMWLESHRSLHRELAGTVRFFGPGKQVGFSIWQEINTFSPYLRAQYDFDEFRQYADWLKPIVYNIPAGARFARYVQSLQTLLFHKDECEGESYARASETQRVTILHDLAPEESLNLFYRLLGLDEAILAELPMRGLSAEYVRRETARTVAGVRDEIKVYPGIGIGVPSGPGTKETEPNDVKAAIRAAYAGGANGIILSRSYAEMRLTDLQAAGDALRESGRV